MRTLGLATFMVPFGLSMATAVLIGRSIGKESEALVGYYFKLCMIVSVVIGIFQVFLLMLLENVIIDGYT